MNTNTITKFDREFNDVMTILNYRETFDVKSKIDSYNWKHEHIQRIITRLHPEQFETQNWKKVFRGSKEDIAANRLAILREAFGNKIDKPIRNISTVNDVMVSTGDEERVPFVEQLDNLKDLVKLIIKGASNSLIISGQGGVGKTYTTEKVLSAAGYEDGEEYFKNTGSSSAIGLYMMLYRHRDGILLFDDCDSVWDSQEARNLLKAACDTKPSRKLVWNKKSSLIVEPEEISDDNEEGLIPRYFFFTGKIIFISNLDINKLDNDGAMRSRSLILNVSPTNDELLDYMGSQIDSYELEPGLTLSHDERMEVFNLIRESKNKNALSLRRLVRALNIRAAADPDMNWKNLVQHYA